MLVPSFLLAISRSVKGFRIRKRLPLRYFSKFTSFKIVLYLIRWPPFVVSSDFRIRVGSRRVFEVDSDLDIHGI